jgi:hypothetical protein
MRATPEVETRTAHPMPYHSRRNRIHPILPARLQGLHGQNFPPSIQRRTRSYLPIRGKVDQAHTERLGRVRGNRSNLTGFPRLGAIPSARRRRRFLLAIPKSQSSMLRVQGRPMHRYSNRKARQRRRRLRCLAGSSTSRVDQARTGCRLSGTLLHRTLYTSRKRGLSLSPIVWIGIAIGGKVGSVRAPAA